MVTCTSLQNTCEEIFIKITIDMVHARFRRLSYSSGASISEVFFSINKIVKKILTSYDRIET